MVRQDVISLKKTFDELGKIKVGTIKFHYFVAKNLETLEKEFSIYQKMEEDLSKQVQEINMKYILRDDKGEFITEKSKDREGKEVDVYKLDMSKSKERSDELKPFDLKFDEYVKFLNEEIKLELKTIKLDQIPDEVDGNTIKLILSLIEE